MENMIHSWKAQIVCWIVEIYQPSQWESTPNAITLLHHGGTKAKDDADEMQVICGGLDAFLDFEKNSSILLSCLLQMSMSVIIMLNVGANDRMKNFVFNLFGSYKPGKQREVIQKYSDLFLLLQRC